MRRIDGKYSVDGDRIINTMTGEAIPEDEPVFLLRARDNIALKTLYEYLGSCSEAGCGILHMQTLVQRIAAFQKWSADNPEKMKEPGSSLKTPEEKRRGHIQ